MRAAPFPLRPTNEIHLAESEITIAEALREEGYKTALFGKWHLGSRLEWYPLNHGFDEFYGVLHSNDMPDFVLYQDAQVIENPVNQTTLTQRYTAESLRFIEENRDQPFFLYLPHSFPHVPLFVSSEFENQSDAGLYGDVVETIDWSMGEILDKLKELEIDEHTMVIFTSDNGPWFEGSSGQFRNRKGSSWEGGLRVPFIARWPGVIPTGSHSSEAAMNIDKSAEGQKSAAVENEEARQSKALINLKTNLASRVQRSANPRWWHKWL